VDADIQNLVESYTKSKRGSSKRHRPADALQHAPPVPGGQPEKAGPHGAHDVGGTGVHRKIASPVPLRRREEGVKEPEGVERVVAGVFAEIALSRRRDETGGLALWAGNTAIHVFDRAFLERVQQQADSLPFHRAKKKVPYVDESGNRIEPEEPNAIKFERFIFDLLPHAKNAIVVEIDPACGFAPVKNATGAARDTPETARAAVLALHRRWLEAAGAEPGEDVEVEIAPSFALSEADVKRRIEPGTRFAESTYLT